MSLNEIKLSIDLKIKSRDTRKQKRMLIESFGCCEICGYDYTPSLQVHHMVRHSDGGSNDIENLALLCPNCHSLVHSLVSDSSNEHMSCDETDAWMQKNFNGMQRDKIFFYSLRLLRGEFSV